MIFLNVFHSSTDSGLAGPREVERRGVWGQMPRVRIQAPPFTGV